MLVLIAIMVFILLMQVSKLNSATKKEDGSMPEAQLTQAVASPAPAYPAGLSAEVVAAITGAVVAMEGEGAVIHSIAPAASTATRTPRPLVRKQNSWAAAGRSDYSQPF